MTPEELTAAVQAGKLTPRQAYFLFAALYGRTLDTSQLVIPCEECGAPVSWDLVCSYKVWMPHPGHRTLGHIELDADTTCNGQHYCCSPQCAQAAAVRCILQHHEPERARRLAAVASSAAAAAPAAPAPADEGGSEQP